MFKLVVYKYRHLFYDLELTNTVASSTYVQGGFSHEERWDPNAIENIRALPWLWDTTEYDHGEAPHVKMDDPEDRDSENYDYGK